LTEDTEKEIKSVLEHYGVINDEERRLSECMVFEYFFDVMPLYDALVKESQNIEYEQKKRDLVKAINKMTEEYISMK
jgi:hypothetical protein